MVTSKVEVLAPIRKKTRNLQNINAVKMYCLITIISFIAYGKSAGVKVLVVFMLMLSVPPSK